MSDRAPQATLQRYLPVLLLGMLAALLLLWGLGNKYLWQDEAATAVLARRMLTFGRPLAYDGVNLITTDHFVSEYGSAISQRTGDPKRAIDYYIQRGELSPDTTWRWHPWGQFIVAAISIKLLGPTTVAARLPFALAGIATVLLLYRFVLVRFGSVPMASLASLLLVLNSYWILHSRQCRYYSLSSLLLVLTLIAYARWQWGGRWGAAAFIAAAWCWFQVDYGTLWPVLLILFVDAFLAQRKKPWQPLLVGLALSALLAPFIYYFQLWHRASDPIGTWWDRFQGNLFNLNEYVVPLLVLIAAILLLGARWRTLASPERRLIAICCGILVAFVFWVPTAAPAWFLRYVVMITPVACLVTAWLLLRLFEKQPALAWAAAALLIVTPWVSKAMHPVLRAPAWYRSGSLVRPELHTLAREIFGHTPDPNRMVVEWLRRNAKPTDEILINYEDVPLMYYLPNPIRGGVAAFRAEDDWPSPPEFLILRRSVHFVHWPIFAHELERYPWQPVPLDAPDVMWGNNPDPLGEAQDASHAPSLFIARRKR